MVGKKMPDGRINGYLYKKIENSLVNPKIIIIFAQPKQ